MAPNQSSTWKRLENVETRIICGDQVGIQSVQTCVCIDYSPASNLNFFVDFYFFIFLMFHIDTLNIQFSRLSPRLLHEFIDCWQQ